MLRRIASATRAALSPANIRASAQAGMAMTAVMPSGRTVHQARTVARQPPVPEELAAGDRAARRAPYCAPGAPPVTIDRFVTSGDPGAGLAVVSQAGLAGRTHEVWGCFPSAAVVRPAAMVDGRLGLPANTLGPTTFPWVEWTVVHAAGPGLSAALAGAAEAVLHGAAGPSYVEAVQLDRSERWLDRPTTEPLPWDEDLAALMAHASGLDPARCLGVHRVLDWGLFGPPQQRSVMVEPSAIRVLGRADAGLRPARSALARQAPVRSRADDPLAVRVDVLDPTLRMLVEPLPWTLPPPAATPYPDLPVDAEELLTAYLEIVGIDPGDCYGAATTIRDQQSAPVVGDGDPERASAASLVTVVYRDREVYEKGRERFSAWSAHETGTTFVDEREAVEGVQRWGARALKVKNLDTVGLGTFRNQKMGQAIDQAFYPYCAGPTPRP